MAFPSFLENSHFSHGPVQVKIYEPVIIYITRIRQAFDSTFGNGSLVESKVQISSVCLLRFLKSYEDEDLEGLFWSDSSGLSEVVYFKRKT